MKNKIYLLAVLFVGFSDTLCAVLCPSYKAMQRLAGLKLSSSKARDGLGAILEHFRENIENEYSDLERKNQILGNVVVPRFAIPAMHQKEMEERVRALGLKPFFALLEDPSLKDIAGAAVLRIKDKAVIVLPDRTIKAFSIPRYKNSLLRKLFLGGKNEVANRALLEHEYCHLEHDDNGTRCLLKVLAFNYNFFSESDFSQIQAVFDENFLFAKKAIIAKIRQEAQLIGMDDFVSIPDSKLELLAYWRYCEKRADDAVLKSKDRQLLEAWRENKTREARVGMEKFIKTIRPGIHQPTGLVLPQPGYFTHPFPEDTLKDVNEVLAKFD